MKLSEVQQLFQERLHIESFVQQLSEGSNALVTGLSSSAKTMYVRGLYETSNRPVYVIVSNMLSGQKMYDDLVLQMGEEQVFLYPAEELIAAEMSVSSYELRAERIETIHHLANERRGIYIIPVAGLKRRVMPKAMWEHFVFTIEVGRTMDWESVERRLVLAGYSRETLVNAPGQFAVRGGIIDIYTLDQEYPIRIELFDDEVDSIRTFDAESQRSLQNQDSATIGPAVELIIPDEQRHEIATGLERDLAKRLLAMENDTFKEKLLMNIQGEIDQLREGIMREQVVTYIPYLEHHLQSLIHYFNPNGYVIYDEFARIQEVDETLEREEEEWFYHLFEQLRIPQLRKVTYPLSEVMADWTGSTVYFSLFKRSISHVSLEENEAISCKPMQQFHGQMHLLKVEIDRWMTEGFTVYVSVQDKQRQEQVLSILDDYELSKYVITKGVEERGIVITTEQFRTGFELPMQKLALVTDQELFKMKQRPRRKTQKLTNAERIKSYSEINKGDYVVHVHHGIGRFYGVVTLEVGGVHKDYLDIRYRGDDKVYVPADQIELVQKYVPSGEKEPKLHKLGGTEWKKAKAKVTRAVKDIADELVKLYAKREAEKGFAFSPDDDMQHSFETAFPYDETDDQLRSIEEIKKDMERERPMDRLLCGDVGYGKTEVAIRAAFKAINDGKQVAFLVPTTILAQQHYETMVERFANFPVEVGLLNRFRTKKEQELTLRDLKAGVVDVVVGTHRLLSKDVQFKDLGLLIVDEEQRFGVTHKEKIKQMRTNVDVLTLTATPIPRTLHMSMVGVRDLSVIETPPANRFPVQTYVMEHNFGLVREAIEREMSRGGQVFYLYNRVEDMDKRVAEIQELVPEARIASAHGQMSETMLESVILDFLEGQYDVLVTTTIIETGIDVPNVNTLIVHDADKMGLSQLYQLRGRVGRSNRVAYSYFLYQKDKVLTEVAESRLQAIKEFTELGSGFKIAMRDLSIRGAGNLLGAEQHGFIDSVGFDLYSQMLQEAIEEKQEVKEQVEESPIEISLAIDAYLPDSYIPDGFQKIQMYKRIQAVETVAEYEELFDEMIDRFGDMPLQAELLLRVAKMKALGKQAGVEQIKKRQAITEIRLSEAGTAKMDGPKVVSATVPFGRAVGFSVENNQFILSVDDRQTGKRKDFDVIEQLLEILASSQKELAAT